MSDALIVTTSNSAALTDAERLVNSAAR